MFELINRPAERAQVVAMIEAASPKMRNTRGGPRPVRGSLGARAPGYDPKLHDFMTQAVFLIGTGWMVRLVPADHGDDCEFDRVIFYRDGVLCHEEAASPEARAWLDAQAARA